MAPKMPEQRSSPIPRRQTPPLADKKSLFWLASYPKSGNTWCRIFLANYLFNRRTPMPINQVHRAGMGDAMSKAHAVFVKGPFDPTDHLAVLKVRPMMLRSLSSGGADLMFVKTHNARTEAFGITLIPKSVSRGAIYIIRHPLDVACSYGRFYDMTAEQACDALSRPDNTIAGSTETVPQYLGNWSDHVLSWTKKPGFPVMVLRYEDLLTDPAGGFREMLKHIGMSVDEDRLDRAVRFSSFSEVKSQEERDGFIEKSATAERFFHAGGSGNWRTQISPEAADRFLRTHRKTMRAYGYTL